LLSRTRITQKGRIFQRSNHQIGQRKETASKGNASEEKIEKNFGKNIRKLISATQHQKKECDRFEEDTQCKQPI
jgi:hypothetical protein